MTIKRAEHLTGYQIRQLSQQHGQARFGAFEGTELIAQASGRVDWMALRTLVHRVYLLHSRISMQRHDWRCARCRSHRPLQIHHRKYRSHGGTHQINNLEPVCWDCHRVIHETERSQ